MNSNPTESAGVQKLIDRLHQEGVSKGQSEADALLSAAREQAAEILEQAKQEAESILNAAREQAEQTRINGEGAIRLAGRDASLRLTEELRADFVRKLQSLVGHTLKDREFLKSLILEIARHSLPESEKPQPLKVWVLMERDVAHESADDARQELDEFVRSLSGEALRDGLTFKVDEHDSVGVRVQVVDDELEIDLTTETLTELLLQHLSPRFRAIMEPKT
ncbi:hypothetical protein [Thalassoroseus pseudoceratinae]|uniref:hypothetical protein n=1 Tax=Thalassoroseus pseudoceratinae TaxID=2713176 RepID=UPI00141EDADB|nr:hypothetical protein [Thalassoroseus pseudoceratinae]